MAGRPGSALTWINGRDDGRGGCASASRQHCDAGAPSASPPSILLFESQPRSRRPAEDGSGFSARSKALQSIGYREACLYLEGHLSLAEAITATQTATRQYAKRQRTWFRREQGIKWLAGFGDEEKVLESSIHHLQVDIRFS